MSTRTFHVTVVGAVAALACLLAGSAAAANAPEAMITGVTPMQAMIGQTITVSGENLNGTRSVTIGGQTVSSFAVDPAGRWVKAIVPSSVSPGAATVVLDVDNTDYSTGPITIQPGSVTPQPLPHEAAGGGNSGSHASAPPTVGGGISAKLAPRITLFSPAAGRVGRKVMVYGSHFTGVTWVKLGGIRASFSVLSPSRLSVIVPKRAHSGKLSVHASGGTGVSTHTFRVVATPAV